VLSILADYNVLIRDLFVKDTATKLNDAETASLVQHKKMLICKT
jgi:hypothetical protein